MSARETVYLFDAHYQIFRAYHSMPDLRAPDDTPVGALRGYTSILIKFLREYEPTHVAAAFDHDLDSFRNEIYPGYKGELEAPEDLEPQFGLCLEATRALGIPAFEVPNYEADDVLATLTRKLVRGGANVVIITRDKDLGALVSQHVQLLDLASNELSGPKQIHERLGVPPALVEDYLTLMGDSVDCIPGVRGIGAKTAAALLNHFGSLEKIPRDPASARWQGLELRGKSRIAQRVAEGDEELELSSQLVHMRDDLPLRVRRGELRYRGAHRKELFKFFQRMGMDGMFPRISHFRN